MIETLSRTSPESREEPQIPRRLILPPGFFRDEFPERFPSEAKTRSSDSEKSEPPVSAVEETLQLPVVSEQEATKTPEQEKAERMVQQFLEKLDAIQEEVKANPERAAFYRPQIQGAIAILAGEPREAGVQQELKPKKFNQEPVYSQNSVSNVKELEFKEKSTLPPLNEAEVQPVEVPEPEVQPRLRVTPDIAPDEKEGSQPEATSTPKMEQPEQEKEEESSIILAEGIFNNIYSVFKDEELRGIARDKKSKVGRDFVQRRMNAAENRIKPFKSQTELIKKEEISRHIEEYVDLKYKDNPYERQQKAQEGEALLDRFIKRTDKLVGDGDVDELTAKMFFGRFRHLDAMSEGYNSIVRKSDEPPLTDEQKDAYSGEVLGKVQDFADVRHRDDTHFVHVNADNFLDSNQPVVDRYYISSKLSADPAKVVELWSDAVKQFGRDELYFKFSPVLAKRYDNLVVYVTPETREAADQAIKYFSEHCPEELLSDTPFSTGVPIAKGVSRGPEPNQLNELLRIQGSKTMSYNSLMASLMELSLQRAGSDLIDEGSVPNQVNPKELSRRAEPYFQQLLLLSGIDPKTMELSTAL